MARAVLIRGFAFLGQGYDLGMFQFFVAARMEPCRGGAKAL